jgi:hypothetical protein
MSRRVDSYLQSSTDTYHGGGEGRQCVRNRLRRAGGLDGKGSPITLDKYKIWPNHSLQSDPLIGSGPLISVGWAQWNLNQSLKITIEKGLSLSLSCVNLYKPN